MVSELLGGYNFHRKFSKGHISIKKLGGVMSLILCTLPDNALYLYDNALYLYEVL